MNDIILKAENINKRFSGVVALSDASLEVRRGEVHALVGANGAGKSTLIKIITGAYTEDSGQVFLDGKEIKVKSTFDAREKGICAVYQEFSLINTLTVAENIYMGRLIKNKLGPLCKVDWKSVREHAQKTLDLLGCNVNPETKVGDLSVSQKQMVEIAKALSNDIRVLIMDEPTASLSEDDIQVLFKVIRNLQKKDVSVIYVSHRLEELPMICDRISVYRDGRYIKTLNIEDAPKAVIIENMVGKAVNAAEQQNHATDKVLLQTENFSSEGKFKQIDITLHEGEILGIAGLDGAGRTEFVRALFGVDPITSGKVFVEGKEMRIRSPRDAKRAKLGFVTEDRKEEGLIFNMNIASNIGMTILRKLKRGIMLDLKKESEISQHYIKSLKIKCVGCNQMAKNLSGGNQQKVVLAKWLATKPKVLILDEPTRGIDVGAKDQIYTLINELASQGIGVIFISSELPEVLQLANRVIVLSSGEITANLKNSGVTQEMLLDYATSETAV